MRDITIALILAYCFFASFRKPHIGFLCWVWVSLMNPHKLCWGFIATAPVAFIIIVSTIIGTVFYKEKGKLFQHAIPRMQFIFIVWAIITTVFAISPEHSWGGSEGLNAFIKIQVGVFLSYLLINSKEKVNLLVWLIFISIGYYGTKGGVFTLVSGGAFKVWGPQGSMIEDNNSLACALLMVLPLGSYLLTTINNTYARYALIGSMGLIGISILGSNSRGAFLGLLALLLFWGRNAPGKQKILVIFIAVFIAVIALTLMPDTYWQRMHTVKTYDQDASAMGRINAWWCAFNLANNRLLGAGFEYASPLTFSLYAPNPLDLHTAHSIYFQVLGDHGWIGLLIFLTIGVLNWSLLGGVIKRTNTRQGLEWANQLARMLQLSLIAYFVAGAFLSLPYYDLYWQIAALGVIINTLVSKAIINVSSAPAGIAHDSMKKLNYANLFIRSAKKSTM